MSKHYLIFGSGMLAKELQHVIETNGHTWEGWSRKNSVDISDKVQLFRFREPKNGPWRWHGIFNAAAYTNVDGAEDDERTAFAVNALGAENVARLSSIPLVHFSTDAVFDDGDQLTVPKRYEARPVRNTPRGVYARSKMLGEHLVEKAHPSPHILRIGNTYGSYGTNWASRLRERFIAKEPVVADWNRRVTPTWARWVAETAVRLIGEPHGLYHVSASGGTRWSTFAETMLKKMGLDLEVGAVSGANIEYKAPRSLRGDLSSDMLPLRGIDVPTWDALLSRYLESCSTRPTSGPPAVPAESAF